MNRRRRASMALLWIGARRLGRWSVVLGGLLTSRLWFTPWPTASTPSSSRRETGWLAGTQPVAVAAGRWQLRGFTAGDGPLVLLVHGWGDHAARMGAFVAPLVARGFRVVGLDQPGHGAGRMTAVDIPTMAAALQAVAARLGPVHAVIGHSLGGTVSTVAVRDGMAPTALVLLAAPVRLEHAVTRFQALLGLPERAIEGLRRSIERRFGPTVWDDYAADGLALDVPTMVFHDTDDAQVDIADGRRLAAAWPHAQLIETTGLGHQRIVRDPDVVAAAVAFVAHAGARAAPSAGVGV